MITYLSQLYDVFPEPPKIHPLFDYDSQRQVQEYRELAHMLLIWCKEKTSFLQERAISTTLIELKRLLTDLNRFRNEEVPPKLRDKQKLNVIYSELEKYFEAIGEIDVEPDLRPEILEKHWSRLISAIKDREIILLSEIDRIERLQRLADKIQREIKHTDQCIIELDSRISEERRRIVGLQPADAEHIVDTLRSEIVQLEKPILSMDKDCKELKEGRYPQASSLQSDIQRLHQKWIQLDAKFLKKFNGVRYSVPETTTVRTFTNVQTETRPIGTNRYFKDLQDHTEWCQKKLVSAVEA